ncbi:MAG TPA: hypothetical protein VHZ99_05975 [Steroidobacteraceae bacterium]|jgi:hypothetical protein|nr:hypothetical protein [Steroidobacteraceae bacterium]
MTTTFLMVAHSSAKPGRDADYLAWYRNSHLPDICSIPGVRGGRLLEAIPGSPTRPAATYMAIYELDVDDPMTILQEMSRRHQAGTMHSIDALDPASAQLAFYRQKL